MGKQILRFLGLEKSSEYEKKYFANRNLIASIYMAAVVIVLEAWMVWSLTNHILHSDKVRTLQWLIEHYGPYLGLMACGIVVLVYAQKHYKKQEANRRVGQTLIAIFSFVCLLFGMRVGISSYAGGDQVFGFLTMAIFVCGLYAWKPVISLIVSAGSFGIFYYLCSVTELGVNQDFTINFITLWITMFMFQYQNFNQARRESEKNEALENYNAYLQKMADEDSLTGLYNAHHFDHVAGEILINNTENRQYSVLYANLENLKGYNDKYGFDAGTQLIRLIAEQIREICKGDVCARVSDDHFAIMTESSTVEEKVGKLVKGIQSLSDGVHLDLKVGEYRFKSNTENVPLCLDRAHYACRLLNKMADQNLIEYDERLSREFEMKQFVLSNVDHAVEKGYIKAYFQPIAWCRNGKVAGFEALARWEDPERGILPPYAFISTLEEFRMIDKVDKAIVEQVCIRLHDAIENNEPIVPISVNFSRLDFELYDVHAYLNEMCEKYNVPHKYIDVEVTESALSEETGALYQVLNGIADEKHSLWLDDFGSGYSSLNVLKEYHFDIMKIDMVFLRGFEKNDKVKTVIRAMINLARDVQMAPLCEGVETKEQLDFLQEAGCVRAQGYYFSKPLPWAEMQKLFDEGKLEFSEEFIPQ